MASFFKKLLGKRRRASCTVLVPAAGNSSRMGGKNKLAAPLDGVPVLARTLGVLQAAKRVDEIIVAAREEDLENVSRLCKEYSIGKCTKVVRGGETRAHSTLLAAMEASRRAALLAVHDGARPLATPELVDRVIEAAARYNAAAPALPVKDTIKRVRKDAEIQKEKGKRICRVDQTLDRDALRAVQTPQVFDADLLKAALQAAIEAGVPVTDDCSAVERLGKAVYLVKGEEENLKITTPLDLALARAVLEGRKANGGAKETAP